MDEEITYLIETNRNRWDNTRRCIQYFERRGLEAEKVPHLTSILVRRPLEMEWDDFKRIVRYAIMPRIGSAVISSSTGRMYLCSKKGNHSGEFERLRFDQRFVRRRLQARAKLPARPGNGAIRRDNRRTA